MVQKVRLLLEPPRRVALRARAAVRQEIEAVRNGREQTIGKDNALENEQHVSSVTVCNGCRNDCDKFGGAVFTLSRGGHPPTMRGLMIS